MTPAEIEPATFRFVAQHFNHCATAVPVLRHIQSLIDNMSSVFLCLQGMTHSRYASGGDGRQVWKVAGNRSNKQFGTADMEWSFSVGVVITCHPKNLLENVTQCFRPRRILRKDVDNRKLACNLDLRKEIMSY
jgi:hypothetical protein